jgi:hypothetical protein
MNAKEDGRWEKPHRKTALSQLEAEPRLEKRARLVSK